MVVEEKVEQRSSNHVCHFREDVYHRVAVVSSGKLRIKNIRLLSQIKYEGYYLVVVAAHLRGMQPTLT